MQVQRFVQPPQPSDEQVTPLVAGPQHSLAYVIIPPQAASRKHYHPQAEESYYVVSGVGRMEIEGQTVMLGAGDSVLIEANEWHQIWCAGTENLVFVVTCVPPWEAGNAVYEG